MIVLLSLFQGQARVPFRFTLTFLVGWTCLSWRNTLGWLLLWNTAGYYWTSMALPLTQTRGFQSFIFHIQLLYLLLLSLQLLFNLSEYISQISSLVYEGLTHNYWYVFIPFQPTLPPGQNSPNDDAVPATYLLHIWSALPGHLLQQQGQVYPGWYNEGID